MTMLSVRMKKDVDLATWQILKIQDAYHVVGEVLPTMRPYMSPEISGIDLAGRAVITEDGRHYRLHGREGSSFEVLGAVLEPLLSRRGVLQREIQKASYSDLVLEMHEPANRLSA